MHTDALRTANQWCLARFEQRGIRAQSDLKLQQFHLPAPSTSRHCLGRCQQAAGRGTHMHIPVRAVTPSQLNGENGKVAFQGVTNDGTRTGTTAGSCRNNRSATEGESPAGSGGAKVGERLRDPWTNL